MFKEFFTKKGIINLLSKVRIGGFTPFALLKDNRKNTARILRLLGKRAINGDVPAESFLQTLSKTIKTRKRHTLINLRNIFTGVRGHARNLQSLGKKGKWYNRGVFDSKQTVVCGSFMGMSWDMPYSQIPDKPPRIAEIYHPCRSGLEFVKAGEPEPDERPFMVQFNEMSESQKIEMVGKKKYAAVKEGKEKLESFKDYERLVLTNLDDLGIK